MKKRLVIVLIIAVALIVPYYLLDGENTPLDPTTRKGLEGSFVRLSDGVTHYRIDGPEDGPPVVLIHGYSIPLFLWDDVYSDLTAAGFRVLSYDLYGRGYSDRPEVKYSPELFDRQLAELLDRLNIDGPVDIAGISMGGAVGVYFAHHHPEKIRKLALISPFGFPQELGFLAEMIKTPYLGEYMMAVAGDGVFKGRLPKNFHQPRNFEAIQSKFLEQMHFKGTKRALLSTMRYFMPLDFTESFRAAGQGDRPVLLIWGRHDRVVPFEYNQKVMAAIPQTRFYELADQGHVPPLEKPETVTALIIPFFKK